MWFNAPQLPYDSLKILITKNVNRPLLGVITNNQILKSYFYNNKQKINTTNVVLANY